MRYLDRFLIGFILMAMGLGCLWWGSPSRTGSPQPVLAMMYAFVVLFAIGFVFVSMGLLGMEDDYPAFLSGMVLYFVVGAVIAVVMYVNGRGQWSLAEANSPGFWLYWGRIAAMWPLELVRVAGLLGYR